MEVGEYFAVDGYDIQARAQHDHGEVLVMTNNSSHILVASTWDESMTDGETTGNAKLEAAFPYWGGEDGDEKHDSWQEAYKKGMQKMMELVLRWI